MNTCMGPSGTVVAGDGASPAMFGLMAGSPKRKIGALLAGAWLTVSLALPVAAQEPSTEAGGDKPPAAAPAAPAKATGKKLKKGGKKPLVEPEDTAPKAESTKIEPSLLYRAGTLKPRMDSVYHRVEHGDFVDQLYLTFKFARTYDYTHELVLEPSLRTLRNNPAAWDAYVVEQAYIQSALSSRFALTVGKKTEYEGAGYLVSPSDLLNDNKDIFDPVYQKQGVVFSRLRWRFEDFSLALGFIPRRGHPTKAGRGWLTASADVLETELRLQATTQESEKTTVGGSAVRFFGEHFGLHLDGRWQTRQRWVGEQAHVRYSAYAGDDKDTQADDSPSAFYVAGTRIIFTPRRSVILESINNQSGLLPEEMRTMFDEIATDTASSGKVQEPQTRLIGRHYVFGSYIDEDLIRRTKLTLSWLSNLDDQSAFGTISALYTLSPITSVELAPTFFPGQPRSEFGEMPFSEVIWLIFRGRF